jgi:hypothetical protein
LIRTIARRAAGCLPLLALAGAAFGAAKAPPPPVGRVAEYEAAQRLFDREGAFEPFLETSERWQYAERRPYRALTAGSYAKVEKHLKVGAFYRLQYGARHNDDWTNPGPGRWEWEDTTRRPEHVLILDASPRVNLFKSFVASMKVRFERNFFSAEDVLKVEPELAYFWMDGLTPRATFFVRHEVDFSLNFGKNPVWQRWYYVAALWHANPHLSLGPKAALREEVWSTSTAFRSSAPSNPGYATLFRSWVLGFDLVAKL